MTCRYCGVEIDKCPALNGDCALSGWVHSDYGNHFCQFETSRTYAEPEG